MPWRQFGKLISKLPFVMLFNSIDLKIVRRRTLSSMHIPDGFLDVKAIVMTTSISAAVIAANGKNIKKAFTEQSVPAMGMMAAFIFVAQMLNFPIAPGVSGHLLGSALVTALFGPAAGMVIMTTVVALQALLFHDGGIMVLGANILNMAVIGCGLAYIVQRLPFKGKARPVLLFISGWLSIFIAAFTAAVELGISGVVPFSVVVWPVLIWHALIGVIEGAITMVTAPFLIKILNIRPLRKQEEHGI